MEPPHQPIRQVHPPQAVSRESIYLEPELKPMMWTKLHWVDGPWPGKLALAARPRGGEWLQDEITAWSQAGVNTVFSLLTPEEEEDLDIAQESAQAQAHGMTFLSFPILDRQVPDDETSLTKALEKLEGELAAGRNVVLHCRQGIGRTGLVAACLFLTKGWDSETAVKLLSAARGTAVPETAEQRRWIDHYAARFFARTK
jgi:protein-tyrosine phosphatase